MAPPSKLSHTEAVEAVFSDRLTRLAGEWVEVPVSLFVERVDVKMEDHLPPVALYSRGEGDAAPKLLREADKPYSLLALSVLESVWIRAQDLPALKAFAERLVLSREPTIQDVPAEKRVELIRKSSVRVVEDLYKDPSPENITRSTRVVSSFVYVLMRDPEAYLLLAKLSSHDPYTLQHSVGTAVHAIIVGRKMGIKGEAELSDLGLGGLLHDIGKIKIRREIINKTGPLDELEWQEMRQHAQIGYDMLKDHPLIRPLTKRAVLEHHEDRNGTGYPQGLRYESVHLYSKIVCLCDIFNALTTDRSYSKARTPFDAFQFIRDRLSHKVDEDIFRELVLVYGGDFGR